MNAIARSGIGIIRAYQWTLRPLIGANCRFAPSCSEYAIEALRSHGAMRGSGLAGRRILRCNPWNPGGFDPVPACPCSDSWASRAGPPAATRHRVESLAGRTGL